MKRSFLSLGLSPCLCTHLKLARNQSLCSSHEFFFVTMPYHVLQPTFEAPFGILLRTESNFSHTVKHDADYSGICGMQTLEYACVDWQYEGVWGACVDWQCEGA